MALIIALSPPDLAINLEISFVCVCVCVCVRVNVCVCVCGAEVSASNTQHIPLKPTHIPLKPTYSPIPGDLVAAAESQRRPAGLSLHLG
jgi:hypothetical protein